MRSLVRSWFLRWLNRGGPELGIYTLLVDADQLRLLKDLAKRERRPPEEIASELFSLMLAQRNEADESLSLWHSLSLREQEVAALITRGYTNRQIGQRLVISTETVKTHIRSITLKYGLNTKHELREALAGWDFSAWDSEIQGG
jgi:DNA-binding CsgD family transcriptional regulator